ncbi:hypothetical protein BXZ70DRAFT_498932 [Cristinia sonorae]|uniref:DUF6534 domain-containing protein n=1 Tax=Cristinia sonorae TaxID=1940300 RepID=A0A8K0XLA0_9AGAR|nr:hypothetical protein BXZ70DRAFT_498932 [Cristinia sonorae]
MMIGVFITLCQQFHTWGIYTLALKQRSAMSLIISFMGIHGIWDCSSVQLSIVQLYWPCGRAWNVTAPISISHSIGVQGINPMFYYLWRTKRVSFSKRTSTVLTRLIKLTVETGFITALFTMVELILFVVMRNTTMLPWGYQQAQLEYPSSGS